MHSFLSADKIPQVTGSTELPCYVTDGNGKDVNMTKLKYKCKVPWKRSKNAFVTFEVRKDSLAKAQ